MENKIDFNKLDNNTKKRNKRIQLNYKLDNNEFINLVKKATSLSITYSELFKYILIKSVSKFFKSHFVWNFQ